MATGNPTTEVDEPYADDTVLSDVLGDHAKIRILSVMLANPEKDLNASEVARQAGIDRSSFYRNIDSLRAYGLVEIARTVGNSKMYQINKDSEAAKALGNFEWALLDVISEKEKAGELDENGAPLIDAE